MSTEQERSATAQSAAHWEATHCVASQEVRP